MDAFAGIAAFDDAPANKRIEDQLGSAITKLRSGKVFSRSLGGALFAQRAAARGGYEPQRPLIGAKGNTLFAALARLDNREELRAALELTPAELAATSDSELILRMFERSGEAGIARCLGAFSFAHWDAGTRRLVLGRDCLGMRALFFYRGRDFVAFATTLAALLALPMVPRELDEIVLANYLAINLVEARRTFYQGIERVPSRTIVTIERASTHHRHYWSPDFDAPPPYRRDEDYIERARELLDQAVAAATIDTPRVAISASGGLDSSAVAATAARLGRAESITCYTLVPPAGTKIDVGPSRYFDETGKMQALARAYPGLDVRFIAPEAPHPFELDDTRYFVRNGLPQLNPGNMGWFSNLYDAAVADGHSVLLTGQRGNLGLTAGGRFSLLALLRAGKLTDFARELPAVARETGRSLPRTFVSEVLLPGGPAWLRRLRFPPIEYDNQSVAHYCVLNPAFIAEHDLFRQWQARDPGNLAPHDALEHDAASGSRVIRLQPVRTRQHGHE